MSTSPRTVRLGYIWNMVRKMGAKPILLRCSMVIVLSSSSTWIWGCSRCCPTHRPSSQLRPISTLTSLFRSAPWGVYGLLGEGSCVYTYSPSPTVLSSRFPSGFQFCNVYDTDGEGKCDLKLGDTYLLELSSGFF